LIITFFGASCLASVVVFAACAASARADQIQREAFSQFHEEVEQSKVEKRQQSTSTGRLALNP
jgi:hypothetical protein